MGDITVVSLFFTEISQKCHEENQGTEMLDFETFSMMRK